MRQERYTTAARVTASCERVRLCQFAALLKHAPDFSVLTRAHVRVDVRLCTKMCPHIEPSTTSGYHPRSCGARRSSEIGATPFRFVSAVLVTS